MAYYPVIVPGEPILVRPLEDVFPEMLTINFDRVSDLYATTDGHISMTLSG